MKFTERGAKVQLSRAGTDEAGGKKKEVVGTLRRPEYEISAELRSSLSEEEVQEVEAYIGRARRSVTVDQEYAVANFADTLTKVSNWVKNADAEEVKVFHERIRKQMTKLRRQFASSASATAASEGED